MTAVAAAQPRVSVIIANYNGARFLDDALNSARAQTLRDIEIIVVDDASTDASVAITRRHTESDARVRLFVNSQNGGPAVSRNKALSQARGEWIAVFDSDDLMHPARLERLFAAAETQDAGIVADDMLVFDDANQAPPRSLLPPRRPLRIGLAEYIRSNAAYGRAPALGYLKPMIRASLLRVHGVRYNKSLRIAEDFDLVARLLVHGVQFHLIPEMLYFYRRHSGSISHRMGRSTIEPILRADEAFRTDFAPFAPGVTAALDARRRSFEMALAFDDLVVAVKHRRWRDVLAGAWRYPRAAALLRLPVLARMRRMLPRLQRPSHGKAGIALLSRQRLIGPTNGSSAYLLSLCGHLAQAGQAVHLVVPSPVAFGRWPVLALQPEMAAFASIQVRGGLRAGRFILATDSRIWAVAALTVMDRLAGRMGLGSGRNVKPAQYAVAAPWTREDQLFVARHARGCGDLLMADYAFLTDGFPYTIQPGAPTCVIMHDLFSSRVAQFGQAGAVDTVARLESHAEMALLGQADCVIAIQADEAEIVRRNLAARTVIVAPMAITTVAAASPGNDMMLLFVGSNTAPNVVGLRWFLDAVWPQIRASCPAAVLKVAGTVCFAIGQVPEGVCLLGRVDRLDTLYAEAGVVIAPLLQGSGLKIKLIEALGYGKAIVATPKTLQGVEALLGGIVPATTDATVFAAETLALMADPMLRHARGNAALDVARAAFSRNACYGALLDFVRDAAAANAAARREASPASETKSVIGTAAKAARAAA